jgi:hypothetical protein
MVPGDILTHMYSKLPATQIITDFEFYSHYLARNTNYACITKLSIYLFVKHYNKITMFVSFINCDPG